MAIISVLQGPGPGTGIFLAATVEIEISDDGREAAFVIINETPTSSENPDPLIDQYFFNLSGFDSQIRQIAIQDVLYAPSGGEEVPGLWTFNDSSGPPSGGFDQNSGGCGRFQYVVTVIRGTIDQRLRTGDKLSFTLRTLNETLVFTEESFINAPFAQNGISQEAFSFQRLGPVGELSDCLNTEGVVHRLVPPPPPPPPPPTPPEPDDFVVTHTIIPLPPVVPPIDPAVQPIVNLIPIAGHGVNTIFEAEPPAPHHFAVAGVFFFEGGRFEVEEEE